MSRIVIVGGVAAGMSAASQARRRDPSAEVVLLERGPDVSYGSCGLPYNVADPTRPIDDLVVVSAEQARRERGIDVRTRHEVLALDLARRVVHARDLVSGGALELPWDRLVLATGASAVRPPIPGLSLPGVFVLRELTDGAALKRHLDEARPGAAVIVGAGYIGMEVAEVLRARGLAVTVLEKLPQVLPGFAEPIAAAALRELERNDVRVETGVAVQAVEQMGSELVVATDRGAARGQLVVIAVGVRPNVALAREAGLALGASGAIRVADDMSTSAAGVFAAGDCAEAHHLVLDAAAWIPLGTTANKQGKVAGANAAGGHERFRGIVGTAGFKLFDLEVGRTGVGEAEVARHGLDAVMAVSRHHTRGRHYPGDGEIQTVLWAERGSGRLLGAQMIGAGSGVAKRIDVFATALHARMTVADVEALDLSYAPPFAPVYDPILIAATVARKELARDGGRSSHGESAAATKEGRRSSPR